MARQTCSTEESARLRLNLKLDNKRDVSEPRVGGERRWTHRERSAVEVDGERRACWFPLYKLDIANATSWDAKA